MVYRSFPPYFVIKDGIHGVGVFTIKPFKAGDTLFKLKGNILANPTRTSIQIGKKQHIEDEIGGHVNHSCMPNCFVDQKKKILVCLRDIAIGEEIMFDYNANEDSLAEPFQCECCHKTIYGRNTLAEHPV